MTSLGITGIVLAGGRATRFGSDKLVALLDGRPILHHAITAVATVADEVVVVVGSNAARPPLPSGEGIAIRVVRDAIADGGPLGGLDAGLAVARGSRAIVVGGDQPTLVPALLGELVGWLDHEDGIPLDAVVLVEDGQLRPLPAALRVVAVAPVAAALLAAGTRSLVGLLANLRVGSLEPERWRLLDPRGDSLRDIDTTDDLPGR